MWHIVCLCLTVLVNVQANNSSPSAEVAEETQHAVCKIVTQQSQTSANATITRQLKGVNTLKNFNLKIKQLEIKLLSELNQIKSLIQGHQLKINDQNKTETEDYIDYDYISTEKIQDQRFSRAVEITYSNDTINENRQYIYYWKVQNIHKILQKNDIYIPSPVFTVLGHNLQLKLFPNYFGLNLMGLQLQITTHFLKKYRFAILDQINMSKDLLSQKFGGIASFDPMFQVPTEKLQENNYIMDDSLFIKLIIYLES